MTHATRRRSLTRRPLAVLAAIGMLLSLGSPAAAGGPATRADDLQTTAASTVTRAAAAAATAAPDAGSLTPAAFDPGAFGLSFSHFRGGLDQPIFATNAGDGTNRVYVVEKPGRIKAFTSAGSYLGTLLDIRSRTSKGGEQGLLGLAFHPDFEHNHRYYVNYTNKSGDTVIFRYTTDSTGLRNVGGSVLTTIDQPYANHNGGMLAFGKDGYLYIGMGDGGSAGDPGNRAQSAYSLLGKLLRMNVDRESATKPYGIPAGNPYLNKPGLDLIYHRGLRNPWRFSFDRATGTLFIGDVGQVRYEEIDRYPATNGSPKANVNWGWRVMEGRHCYRPSSGCSTSGKVMPVTEYSHSGNGGGNCSVTGGYVYRGSAYPALVGGYLFADFCSRRVWVIDGGSGAAVSPTFKATAPGSPVSFGETESGELLLVTLQGTVYKISAS